MTPNSQEWKACSQTTKARDFKGIKYTGMAKTPGDSLEQIRSPMLTDGEFEVFAGVIDVDVDVHVHVVVWW